VSVRDVLVIARFEVWRHLRSRHGLLSMVMLVLFCAIAGWRLAEYADQIALFGQAAGPGFKMLSSMVESVTELPHGAISGTLEAHPPVLVGLFALVVSLLPLWALVTTYDQTASDIETHHARYLLFRTDRTSLYLGKSLGALALLAGSLAMALLVLTGFLGLRSDAVGGLSGAVYIGRIWATSVLLAMPFVAFFGLAGALMGRARRTLNASMVYWTGVGIASGIARAVSDGRSFGIEYLYPTARRFELVLDDPRALLPSAAYMLAFTAVCVGLGLWRFRRRDL
jgi:ABC-type transport system involved in multi-copper enzyme maturation permease subunit